MANWLIEQTIDLQRPKDARPGGVEPRVLTVVGDDHGHVWRVVVQDGGQPAELTGTVEGWFQRADGATVVVVGTLEGHVASVTLADACCAVEGPMVGMIRVSGTGGAVTLAERRFLVRRGKTDSIVDPGHAFPSLEHVAGQYTDLYNAYQSLSAQLQTAISAVTVDSEVQGVRAWASSDMISDTAGDAVRGQVDAVNAANAARSETLPAGYRRLAWIRSSGTQYINTNVLQKDITRLEISFASHNDIGTSNYAAVFGSRHYASSTQTDALMLVTYSQTGKAILRYGTGTVTEYDTEMAVKRPQVAVFDREEGTFTVNGDTVSLDSATGWTYGHAMYLMAYNHSGSSAQYLGKVMLYGCDIWAGGVLARHFVPALRLAAEGVTQLAGLYDTVNDVFYADAAGGDFDYYAIEADAVQERFQAAQDDEQLHRQNVAYIDYAWTIGSLSSTNGGEIDAANRLRSGFIPCGAGTTINCVDGSNNICVFFYDKAKGYVSGQSLSNWGSTFTVPDDGFIRILTKKTGAPPVDDIASFAAIADCHILLPAWTSEDLGGPEASELYQFSETRSYEVPNTFKRCFTMGIISDLHEDTAGWAQFVAELNRRTAYVDLAACLGDTTQTPSASNFVLPTGLNVPLVYTVGNHDVGYSTTGGIDVTTVYNKFIKPLADAEIVVTNGKPYYYKDFPDYKLRVICLYEYEAAAVTDPGEAYNFHYHRYISSDQLNWFANTALKTMGDGYGAIVLLHQIVWTAEGEEPIIDEDSTFTVGKGYRYTEDFIHRIDDSHNAWGVMGNNVIGNCIGDIVAAFRARSSSFSATYSCANGLSSVSVSADFSSVGADREFICYVGGHSHAPYVLHLGDHTDQLQILVPCGHTTAAGQRRADDIRPDGGNSFYYLAVNRQRKVVKLLKAGTRITGDCRERKLFETSYSAE